MFYTILFCCLSVSTFLQNKTVQKVGSFIKYLLLSAALVFCTIIYDILNGSCNKLGSIPCKRGQVAVITGGDRGVGLHVVADLLRADMTVVMGVRSTESCKTAIKALRHLYPNSTIKALHLDLTDPQSVLRFATTLTSKFPKINLLVNNASLGIFDDLPSTERGFDVHYSFNFLGHFYLSHLLMKNLEAAGAGGDGFSRIVDVSSSFHYITDALLEDIHMKSMERNRFLAFGHSKLLQLMATSHLNRQFEKKSIPVRCYSADPGVVSSLATTVPGLSKLVKNAEQGAASVSYCCLSPALEEKGGQYISNCEISRASNYSRNEVIQKIIFDCSRDMLGIETYGDVQQVDAQQEAVYSKWIRY